jgi:anti-sigma regulatory factor (Ser/Thr protein kinase)
VPVSGEANFEQSSTEETQTEGAKGYFVPAVKSARDARAAVLALPLDEDRKERAVLVVSELAGNAILHAGGVLWLQIFHDDSRTRVEVADASQSLPGPVDAGGMSGRGLQLIGAFAKTWGAEPRSWGKVVWAEIE